MELLKIDNLKKVYPKHKTAAVDGIDMSIFRGEILGLVGESGCGKSTLARSILRLTEVQQGSVWYREKDILKTSGAEMRKIRKYFQIIFQDPYTSLDPRMKIGATIEEVLIIHNNLSKAERMKRIAELLEKTGLDESYIHRLPSELSGGERQRVGIARALATEPEFIICDEPVSSLDISVQAQILNLLMELQKKASLTYLFISHDLNIVASICDRVAVMHAGKLVETGLCEEIFRNPKHTYTRRLLDSSDLQIR